MPASGQVMPACFPGLCSRCATQAIYACSKSWTARYDGFVQIRAESNDTSSGKVGLRVGSVEVTPLAAIGNGGSRTPVWTVPVRQGETVTLTADGITIGYKTQFIYFGVKE